MIGVKVLLSLPNGDHVAFINCDSFSLNKGEGQYEFKEDETTIAAINADKIIAIGDCDNLSFSTLTGQQPSNI